MLCRLEGSTLVVRLAGVEAGGEEPYRSGTYMAMYVLILQWAAEQGLTRVDLSGCEPFLSKGIFQFKRKMHPEVTLPDNHFREKRLVLRVLRDTPEVRDLLTANPVLTSGTHGGLEAVYFHDPDRPARTDLRWQCPGVSSQRTLDLDEFLDGWPGPPGAAPSRSPPRSRPERPPERPAERPQQTLPRTPPEGSREPPQESPPRNRPENEPSPEPMPRPPRPDRQQGGHDVRHRRLGRLRPGPHHRTPDGGSHDRDHGLPRPGRRGHLARRRTPRSATAGSPSSTSRAARSR